MIPIAGITALFNFLSTPAGQNVVEDARKVNGSIIGWITDLIGVLHKHHTADIPSSNPASIPSVSTSTVFVEKP